tara:strand:- start:8438 stop:8563 length:126 start_codon:yes stop_codon:yes gene_type:complete
MDDSLGCDRLAGSQCAGFRQGCGISLAMKVIQQPETGGTAA